MTYYELEGDVYRVRDDPQKMEVCSGKDWREVRPARRIQVVSFGSKVTKQDAERLEGKRLPS